MQNYMKQNKLLISFWYRVFHLCQFKQPNFKRIPHLRVTANNKDNFVILCYPLSFECLWLCDWQESVRLWDLPLGFQNVAEHWELPEYMLLRCFKVNISKTESSSLFGK